MRSRVDWKYALGLELTNAGFDFSLLSEFRSRLINSQAETQLLDTVIEVFKTEAISKRVANNGQTQPMSCKRCVTCIAWNWWAKPYVRPSVK